MIELADILQASGGQVYGAAGATRFDDFCYDSRQAQPGQLFVAVRTGWRDGHDFILDACRRGVTGVLCERPVDAGTMPLTQIVVADTQTALADWTRLVLRKQRVEVVGVTGSAGKTTAKEAVALVLSKRAPVFKSPANYSGRFGLPIALGRLRPEEHLAVLEMACDAPGEMSELVRMAAPRHGIVLNVSAAHLETLGTLEAVAEEKARLVVALPADGTAFLNADDPRVMAMRARTAASVVTFGLAPQADVRAWGLEATRDGLRFHLQVADRSASVCCRLVGPHNVYAALAAAACGWLYGLDLEEIAAGLAGLEPLPGRLKPLAGRDDILVLDDTFSATPAAVHAALDVLASLPGRPRIAVLGDMSGLGESEKDAHRSLGGPIARSADALVACGESMRLAAQEAVRAGLPAERVSIVYTPEDALRAVERLSHPGATILVKGAAEARLEQVVRGLLLEPELAEQHLVRQAPQWRAVRLKRPTRPTWVEVDLEAIGHNVRWLRGHLGPGVQLLAVLKADGYGHGAIKTARTALNNGATWLGVACLSEALSLREAGIEAPILVLGYTPPWQARETVAGAVTATVFSADTARALHRAATELGRVATVHVKVDTGMGRLGLAPEETLSFVRCLRDLSGIAVQGIFTHLANADGADQAYTDLQLNRFRSVLGELEHAGLRPPLAHAANSAAALRRADAHLDMVRIGIALYGLSPSAEVPCPPDLRPALSFKTQIAQVKPLPAGSPISYGCTYVTPCPSLIAVIPVGYADGFRRAPRHWGEVLVRGVRAPIVGRVCMDQTMIDVTHIPDVRAGDEVVLIGRQGAEHITVDEVAERLGTINYEVVSEILARVPRVS
ncbi:MAG: alanine racemase [Anaerolineae bacterium]